MLQVKQLSLNHVGKIGLKSYRNRRRSRGHFCIRIQHLVGYRTGSGIGIFFHSYTGPIGCQKVRQSRVLQKLIKNYFISFIKGWLMVFNNFKDVGMPACPDKQCSLASSFLSFFQLGESGIAIGHWTKSA
jgi:hypothetical protein